MRKHFLIGAVLLIATLAVYAPVKDHAFVDFDDEEYIVANPRVNTGLTRGNLLWAFTSAHSNNWHPLTWISHMIDVELFGLRPAGHHLLSVLLHALSSLLLFLLLARMTGALWRSAFVAALFALHPLHVESVAWAAERKDILSAGFWFLTLWMYLSYVKRPGAVRYALTLLTFALGLMTKQMLVTLPFVLLLLDYWPLRRFSRDPASAAPAKTRRQGKTGAPGKGPGGLTIRRLIWKRLLIEKIPFFILAALASVTVFLVQWKSGVLYDLHPFPLGIRIENALMSYVSYIGKMFWPSPLAVFYPHPLHTLPWWQVLGALCFLVAVTVFCVKYRRKPYLALGWFWYLGTLVPVIGLVQVGVQAMADRYTYIPLIGLFIMVAWGVPDLYGDRSFRKPVLASAAAVVLALCLWRTGTQLETWQDRGTLYAHAVRAIPDNYWAHNNLGAAIAGKGDLDGAAAHFLKSLEIMPLYPGANKNMAAVLYKKGRYAEALPFMEKALLLQSRNPEYQVGLGLILMKLGKVREAADRFREALRLNPSYPDAREALAEATAELKPHPKETK